MSLKDLKAKMKKENVSKMNDTGYQATKDDRFYIPSVDSDNKVNVKIRLIPSYLKDSDGEIESLESYKEVSYHNISNCGKEKR